MLGGVRLEAGFGEEGHSDGDALCHAVIDAMLGAAGLGDIGEFFPPGDAAWKDADSLRLLAICRDAVRDAGWSIVNIDAVVSCERPAILPYRDAIRRSLAEALGVTPDAVFVKGKSGEGLGDIGEGRAVEALAVCLLEKA
jgi:2-C-methyl-D-erythritol 2,4-cyclodiphosphate synthase/2-C-methyl-D-erythritol 4-phosphate cytidylyltransferase/2-C-methyl-D-erythritol 2,4-cyclodiphosphate synthase